MTGNAGAVPEGHPARAKPQNGHIKRIIYFKNTQHFIIFRNLILFKTDETKR
jgi:hypothetical protein